MNDQRDEEKRPLVYEDRVAYTDGQLQRRRKYICLVLTTLGIGVGLTLAVALPITLSKPTDTPRVVLKSQMRYRNQKNSEETTNINTTDGDVFTSLLFTSSDEPSSDAPFSFAPSSSATTSSSHRHTDEETSRTTPMTIGTSTPDPLASCPEVPKNRRGSVDLELIEGKLLFELYRIQTRNSPAYVDGLSCSVMELDFSPGHESNATGIQNTSNGTMTLNYQEGRFFTRYPRTVEVKLDGSSESPADFTEKLEGNKKGRLSLLLQIDGLVLAYECFPGVAYYPRPAYVIHLYSLLPSTGDIELALALLRLANIWGLNPADERYVQIEHRSCRR